MITDFKDPAPSKFFYKLNRLAYKLWFKLLVCILCLCILILVARIFVFQRLDLDEGFLSIKNNFFSYFEDFSEYKVSKVEIFGASEQLALEIEDLVEKNLSRKISNLSVSNLRRKIIGLDRVKNAIVKLNVKGKISVGVVERKGIGVFSEGKSYVLIDEEGIRISNFSDWRRVPDLPLFVGKGADGELKDFVFNYIQRLQSISSEIEFYEWVGERRWNLHFKSKLIVKLPEKNLGKGLDFLSTLIERYFFNTDAVSIIDLRDLDRPLIGFKDNLTAREYSHIL